MSQLSYNNSWSPYQKALYYEQEGNWEKAHQLVQDLESKDAAWIHAYLHRKEGDNWNAAYWYKRSGREMFEGSLDHEWNILWKHFNENTAGT